MRYRGGRGRLTIGIVVRVNAAWMAQGERARVEFLEELELELRIVPFGFT